MEIFTEVVSNTPIYYCHPVSFISAPPPRKAIIDTICFLNRAALNTQLNAIAS